MVDKTIMDKLGLIYKFLQDKLLICLILVLLIIILMDLIYGKNNKSTKILYVCIIILSFIYGIFIYYKPLLNIIDIYITNIFKLTYFPSIIEYFTMILFTIIIQLISIKKCSKVHKNINIWVGIFIELLFIINIIAMNNIKVDLNTITSIYENDLLLSIFQLSSFTFMIWLGINIIIYFIKELFIDKIELPKLNEIY